jgi:hypothetical protein
MHVVLAMESPPQQDSRLCHRMDRWLTTQNASANDTATSIAQDEGIVAPRAQPLLGAGVKTTPGLPTPRGADAPIPSA